MAFSSTGKAMRADPSAQRFQRRQLPRLPGQQGEVPPVWVLPADRFDTSRLGRASTRTQGLNFGMDLGGNKVFWVLTNNGDRGQVVAHTGWQHDEAVGELTPERLVQRIGQTCRQLLLEKGIDLSALKEGGVGVPGPVARNGVIIELPNIPGFENVDLAAMLTEELGIPVTVGNDVDAAAVHAHGSLKGSRNLMVAYVGTGIGSGFVLGGVPQPGFGEIGHVRVGNPLNSRDDESLPSALYAQRNPGNDPHALEAYVGGDFAFDRLREELRTNVDGGHSIIREWAGPRLDALHPSMVEQGVAKGDRYAIEFTLDLAERLATVLGMYASPLQLDSIVLGGGVADKSPHLLAATLGLIVGRFPSFADVPTFYVPESSGTNLAQGAAYLG